METTKINMGGNTQGKKETEKVSVNTGSVNYSDTTDADLENPGEEEAKKKNIGNIVRTAAVGVGGTILGSGVAMAANGDADPQPEQEPDPQPAHATHPTTAPATQPEPGSESTPQPTLTPTTESVVAPTPETSPHIEEILVDPDDIDGDRIMNIEGTGTVEIDGTEVNAAVVTDEAGNSYYLVDVDGEVNDPNATYDIIVDAETGEMAGLPTNLSVSDAQLMADNGIGYTEPTAGDSNNIAQSGMEEDIYDPSQPAGEETAYETEPYAEDLADSGIDADIDIIDPLS